MSWYNKISSFFSLSTPVIGDDIEKLLSNREFRKRLLEDIDKERKNYASDDEKENVESGIKRVGEFEFNL